MPNYVYNKLRVSGNKKDIEAFNNLIGDDFTFNKFIPMPDVIKNTGTGNNTIDGIRVKNWYVNNSLDWKEQRESERLLTKEELEKLKQIGYSNWYDWSIAYWGVKWDASEPVIKAGKTLTIIEFTTAWSYPCEIMNKIAEMFPTLIFKLTYRNEGEGEDIKHVLEFNGRGEL